jgi:hypothetical protein
MRSLLSNWCSASIVATAWPSMPTIRSPSRSPANAAGLPASTTSTRTAPLPSNANAETTRRGNTVVLPPTPSHARRTAPWRNSCGTTQAAMSTATAKHIDCAPRMIAVLMPMTSPREFSSGPPELPGFSAASVCTTSGIRAC